MPLSYIFIRFCFSLRDTASPSLLPVVLVTKALLGQSSFQDFEEFISGQPPRHSEAAVDMVHSYSLSRRQNMVSALLLSGTGVRRA